MNIEKYMEEYSNELKRKGYRIESIKNYVSCIGVFLNRFNSKAKPSEINEKDIKEYLGNFSKHNTQRSHHSAIKCFYKFVVKQPNKFKYIEYCKKDNNLPIVLSVEEMQLLINAIDNLKQKSVISFMYATACRISEVINLELSHIDRSRGVINFIDAKGGIDRNVMLDPSLLVLLDKYILEFNPIKYLFNGQFSTDEIPTKYSDRSIANILVTASNKIGINKHVNPHLIRHTAATHMVEYGTDINLIQKILGHKTVKTTNIYLHISNNHISKIKSPLSNINLNNNKNEATIVNLFGNNSNFLQSEKRS